MNWRILAVVLCIVSMLIASGCARSNALTGNGSADAIPAEEDGSSIVIETTDVTPTEGESTETPVETPVEDIPEVEDEEVLTNVTEAPTYDQFRNSCSEDSKGVVRTFDDAGTKTVYRNTCLGGILTDFKCVDNAVTSDNTRCKKGCTTTRYGEVCKE